MRYSQGFALEDLGIEPIDGTDFEADPRAIWRSFICHYYLFKGTQSRLWIDPSLEEVFGVSQVLSDETAHCLTI